MKKKKLLALLGGICLVLILVALPFMSACAKPAPAPAPAPVAPIELKATIFIPPMVPDMKPWADMLERITERSNGELVIECLGGPEVIPSNDQPEAVRKGIIDMCSIPPTRYPGLNPVFEMLACAEIEPAEQRVRGTLDYINELHHEVGLHVTGYSMYSPLQYDKPPYGTAHVLLLLERADSPAELAGRTIGPGDVSQQEFFMKDLKMVACPMKSSEAYSAMERGLLEAIIWPLSDIPPNHWEEVGKYIIDRSLLRLASVFSLINYERWKSLPKHLQDLIMEEQIRLENEIIPAYKKEGTAESYEIMLAAGVEFITWSEEDTKWFIETEHKRGFERAMRNAPEDQGEKMYKLLIK